jgi:hypothetical protein
MQVLHDGEVVDCHDLLGDSNLSCASLDGGTEAQENIGLRNSTNSSWNYDGYLFASQWYQHRWR